MSRGLLIAVGTYAEDNPNPRARHHFHDPERVHGASDNYGLDDSGRIPTRIDSIIADFAAAGFRGGSWLRAVASYFGISSLANFELRGRSAIDRALNTTRGGGPASDDSPSNLLALPDAERYLYRALTDSEEDDRENYMALHFVALGHVLHLLQDMGSVAHARNDFVVDHFLVPEAFGARSLEGAADDEEIYSSVVFAAAQAGLFNKPVQAMIGSGSSTVPIGFYEIVQGSLDPDGFDVEDFWDRQPLGEPDDSQPERAGLAERVHNARGGRHRGRSRRIATPGSAAIDGRRARTRLGSARGVTRAALVGLLVQDPLGGALRAPPGGAARQQAVEFAGQRVGARRDVLGLCECRLDRLDVGVLDRARLRRHGIRAARGPAQESFEQRRHARLIGTRARPLEPAFRRRGGPAPGGPTRSTRRSRG